MLSSRDRHIIDDIVEFKGLSINQVGKMWFPKNEHNYYYSRMRLKKLENKGYIKSCLFEDKKIFYTDKVPDICRHKMILMDFYANLISNGLEVKDYKFEYRWFDGKYKSDGMFKVGYKGDIEYIICEVDFSRKTDLKKYDVIFESGIADEMFGVFPYVFIINERGREYKYEYRSEVGEFVRYLDIDMKGFSKVLAAIG